MNFTVNRWNIHLKIHNPKKIQRKIKVKDEKLCLKKAKRLEVLVIESKYIIQINNFTCKAQ